MAKNKRKPFEKSAIVPQDFPAKRTTALMTRSGRLYGHRSKIIRSSLRNKGVPLEKVDTIMAFCKNYFIKHSELPSTEILKELFNL